MPPGDFTVYALIVGAVVAVSHLHLGYVWPQQFAPGKWGRRGIVALLLGYATLAVLPLVVWAPIKFVVLVGGTLWLLKRSRVGTPGEPSAINALQRRAATRDVALLMIMPVVAGVVYAGMWNLGLDDTAVEELFSMMSIVQMLAGPTELVPSPTLQ